MTRLVYTLHKCIPQDKNIPSHCEKLKAVGQIVVSIEKTNFFSCSPRFLTQHVIDESGTGIVKG